MGDAGTAVLKTLWDSCADPLLAAHGLIFTRLRAAVGFFFAGF
jgi:hypothetical protein